NVGAYLSFYGAAVPAMSGARASNGCYDIPLVDHEVRMLFTNTAPVDAYRGAGRPEMGFLIERLVHKTALELGLDPIDLKRRNFIRSQQMPYTNSANATYESGAFEALLGKAMKAIDWAGFDARKADTARRGMLLGHAIANYIEVTGSGLLTEEVDIAVKEPGGEITLSASATATNQTWPNGCQAAEIEVDPHTGAVRLTRIVAVDDIGTVINPLIAHGQMHGGVAQGVGQALLENVVYDAETGQLLSGSFLDYAMPRADDLPSIDSEFDESLPTRFNRLGAKGVGESGTHGAI